MKQIDWAAIRAARDTAPFRVVRLIPMSDTTVEVTICDSAGTLSACLAWAERLKLHVDAVSAANQGFPWSFRVAHQNDAMRQVIADERMARAIYPTDQLPLTFI